MMKRINKIFVLIIYVIIMSFVCIGSSPILDYMDPDSQNFWLIGRSLASGQVAYRDIFDHKGLYIFLIDELAALISLNSEIALFFMEVIAYSVSIILVYKMVKNIISDEKVAMLSSMAYLGVSFNFFTFVTGNLTESWSMVFQLISIYFIVKYYTSDSLEHPPVYMFIHGLCACIVGFMRPNNAGMWIPFGIVLAFRLFANKKVSNFLKNLGMLILGVFVGAIPLIYYGFKHDCFDDIWYGTFTANFEYASNNSGVDRLPDFFKHFIFQPAFLIVILSIISVIVVVKYFKNNKYLVMTFVSMFVCSLFFMNVSMRYNGQYYHLYMVFIIPVIVTFFYYFSKWFKPIVWIIAIVLFTLVANLQLIKQVTKYGAFHLFYEAAVDMREIMENDPGDMVQVTGCNSVFYNVTHTVPHIKYFITYGGGLDYSVFPDATLQQADSITSGVNDYVIVNYYNDNQIYGVEEIDGEIWDYLEDNYELVYDCQDGIGARLYKKNEY